MRIHVELSAEGDSSSMVLKRSCKKLPTNGVMSNKSSAKDEAKAMIRRRPNFFLVVPIKTTNPPTTSKAARAARDRLTNVPAVHRPKPTKLRTLRRDPSSNRYNAKNIMAQHAE